MHLFLLWKGPQPQSYFAVAKRLLSDAGREQIGGKGRESHSC